ncbi:hypothetical protein [Methylorubrum sp. SB2]|uniref:hypothetical protein n=1 Tax=Methylorubrum subtropicum TaxID=3138812 RepID=UPI00313E20C7
MFSLKDRNKLCTSPTFAAFAFALTTLWIAGCNVAESPEQKLKNKVTSACEDKIKAGLASPSGYKRIAYTEQSTEGSEFIANRARNANVKIPQSEMTQWMASSGNPILYEREIEYDAPNQYNALIRLKVRCEFYATDKNFQSVDPSRVALVFIAR